MNHAIGHLMPISCHFRLSFPDLSIAHFKTILGLSPLGLFRIRKI